MPLRWAMESIQMEAFLEEASHGMCIRYPVFGLIGWLDNWGTLAGSFRGKEIYYLSAVWKKDLSLFFVYPTWL